MSYGGITVTQHDSDLLLVGGNVAGSNAGFYAVKVVRDANRHITSLTGPAGLQISAPKLSGSAVYAPTTGPNALFYTIESGSGGVDAGMVEFFSSNTNKVVGVIPETASSLVFAPEFVSNFRPLYLLGRNGRFYAVPYAPDRPGDRTSTYSLGAPSLLTTLFGGTVAGMAYVHRNSPGFTSNALLVAELNADRIVAYDVDHTGNPFPDRKRVFYTGLRGISGMNTDPLTGDLLITTRTNSTSGIYRISGFWLNPPPSSFTLNGCAEITLPGRYAVSRDIEAVNGCIFVRNTHDVSIDCGGNTIRGGVLFENVQVFSVRNCDLQAASGRNFVLVAANSSNGLIANNTMGNRTENGIYEVVLNVFNTTVTGNTMALRYLALESAVGVTVRGNQITCGALGPGSHCTDLVWIRRGSNNTFETNVVNGTGLWQAPQLHTGLHGLAIEDEKNLNVFNNSISNFNESAIETRGNNANLVISGNTLANARFGIKGGRYNSLTNLRFANNGVTNAEMMFSFVRQTGLRLAGWDGGTAPADTGVFFRDNVFLGNTLTHPPGITAGATGIAEVFQNLGYIPGGFVPGERIPLPSEFILTNNTFTGNDFRAGEPPKFGSPVVPGRIIDGGGNRCVNPPAGYPLVCQP